MSEAVVELPFQPFAHQRAAHAMRLAVRFLVLVWHRRGGKTVFAVLELLIAALACTKERGRYGYVAPQLKQAKGVAWDYLKHYARAIPGIVINESELWVELPNKARIRLFGADNPDSLRGLYFDGIVLDEVADMKPELWGEIIRPALADRQGWAIFIGTPKGLNLFSELYYRALQEPDWKADLKRALDTGVIPEAELDQARREMSAPQFAQEMECDFAAAADNVLLSQAEALEASRRELARAGFIDEVKILGVDVARFGSDRSVMFARQGKVAFKPEVRRQQDTMQLVGQVSQFMSKWQPDATFVDVTGIGGGVVDRLRQLSFNAIGVDFGSKATNPSRYINKRVEMWVLMAEWVKSGGCIPNDPELVAELCAPTYRFTADNRCQLESKDDLRGRGLPSPDKADALALTFAHPVTHPALRVAMRSGGAVQNPHGADAYSIFKE